MSKDDKTLSRAELELTQKMQLHFPAGEIRPEIITQWNGCSKEVFIGHLKRTFSKGPDVLIKTESPILELISTVIVPATNVPFVAKERFVLNTKSNAPVKISDLGSNFTAWFLSGDGKVEEAPRLSDGQVPQQIEPLILPRFAVANRGSFLFMLYFCHL